MNKKDEIGYLIHKINKRFKEKMDDQLSEHDLTFSQSQILRNLQANDGTLSQKQLEDLLKVSHPTIVGLVQRLEAKGYVETYIDDSGKRNRMVRITELADNFKKDVHNAKIRFDNRLVKGLSAEELDELYRLLNKMYENIA